MALRIHRPSLRRDATRHCWSGAGIGRNVARVPEPKKKIVVLDDDRDVAEVIQTVLLDEGFAVSCLYGPDLGTIRQAIQELAPDCAILDGSSPRVADPWALAEELATHSPMIPTVLLTGSDAAREEALLGESDRAKAAGVKAVVPKPFDIDRLVAAVRAAMGSTGPTDAMRRAATNDTAKLTQALREVAAFDVRTSSMGREWVMFRAKPSGDLFKVYRWQLAGAYFVGRYSATGTQLEPLAQVYDTDAAIAYCLSLIQHERQK